MMTSELLALIAIHFACTETAIHRPLTEDEVHGCAAVYQEVKLAFVPGVSVTDYQGLNLRERMAVSKAGFLAFLAWREDNPETVRHLVAVARGEEELRPSG